MVHWKPSKSTETMNVRELLSGMSLFLVLFSLQAEAADVISGVPHIVDGGGYTTQFITFSGTPAEPTSDPLQMFTQSGGGLNIAVR